MCWVMPPDSLSTRLEERMASRRVVLPWSTWPMMATAGELGARSALRAFAPCLGPPPLPERALLPRLGRGERGRRLGRGRGLWRDGPRRGRGGSCRLGRRGGGGGRGRGGGGGRRVRRGAG